MPTSNPTIGPAQRTRPMVVLAGLAVITAAFPVLLSRLAQPGSLGVDDFVEYWAAGRLNATGGNPYSSEQLLQLQKDIGLQGDQAIMMWNPPWTLTFVMPFGLLPYTTARVVWLLFQVVLVILCGDLLWRHYGGSVSMRWIAWAVALTFAPSIVTLRMGQIVPLMLAGLTGFLVLEKRRSDGLAGAMLVLATIKPHIVYLVGVAVLLVSLQSKRWRILAGAVVAVIVTSLIPMVFNPQVFLQFRQASVAEPPVAWLTTTFGGLLRFWLGTEIHWLQFLPTLLGLCCFIGYWFLVRSRWNWSDQMPLLTLLSVVTASYGWLGDQVVLLVALVPMAVVVAFHTNHSKRSLCIFIYVTLNAIDLMLNYLINAPRLWEAWPALGGLLRSLQGRQQGTLELLHLWTAPALLLGWLALNRWNQDMGSITSPESRGENEGLNA